MKVKQVYDHDWYFDLRNQSFREQFHEAIQHAVCLSERDKNVLIMRFGLPSGRPKTLQEVGDKIGVTRERIRQIQNIALVHLRRELWKRVEQARADE